MLFARILYGILLFAMWFYWLKYRRQLKSWTWSFYWAEKYLWNGWTYTVLILLCIGLMFLWVIAPFWWLEKIFWPWF